MPFVSNYVIAPWTVLHSVKFWCYYFLLPGFSVEFSVAVAVVFSPVTFAAKVIRLYCFVVGKQTDTEVLLQPLHLLTTPVTGVTGSNENLVLPLLIV